MTKDKDRVYRHYLFHHKTLIGKDTVDGISVLSPDTSIVALQLDQLSYPPQFHTGDPVICSNPNCSAVMSCISMQSSLQEQVWIPCCTGVSCTCTMSYFIVREGERDGGKKGERECVTDRQREKQTGRQADRYTDTQTDRQTDR